MSEPKKIAVIIDLFQGGSPALELSLESLQSSQGWGEFSLHVIGNEGAQLSTELAGPVHLHFSNAYQDIYDALNQLGAELTEDLLVILPAGYLIQEEFHADIQKEFEKQRLAVLSLEEDRRAIGSSAPGIDCASLLYYTRLFVPVYDAEPMRSRTRQSIATAPGVDRPGVPSTGDSTPGLPARPQRRRRVPRMLRRRRPRVRSG